MSKVLSYFRGKFQRNPELRESVFGKSAQQSQPQRSQNDLSKYRQWRTSPQGFRISNWLLDQYETHQRQPFCTDEGIDFISTSQSKSFRIHPALTKFSDESMLNFYHFIAEKMESLGYVQTLNEKRKFNSPYWVETLQHQHFKCFYESNHPILQGFDTIQIRVMFKNTGFCYLEMEAFASNVPHATVDFSALLEILTDRDAV